MASERNISYSLTNNQGRKPESLSLYLLRPNEEGMEERQAELYLFNP